jgi:uncharacterized ParB-like nuclease family protein
MKKLGRSEPAASPAPSGAQIAFDSAGRSTLISSPSERDFDRARKQAFVQDVLSLMRFDPPNLLPFETVRQKLDLGEKTYRVIQTIPLAQIAGSVGRAGDFTRTFLPRTDRMRTRWQKVGQVTAERGMPPIQVYQVGQVYFVLDGNHRVSVARQAGRDTIQAHVWEYETRVPLEPDDTLRDVLVREEYLEFLERTHLDRHRPDVYMILTRPGGYRHFEEQVAIHRHYMELERGDSVRFEDAAANWYDSVYCPIVDVIHREKMLRLFPGRTEADLVNWIIRNQERLRQRYGRQDISSEELARKVAGQAYRNWWTRLRSWIRRKLLRWPVYTGEPWEPR